MELIPSIINTDRVFRTSTQPARVKTAAQRNDPIRLWLCRRRFFGGVISLFGSFIGLADDKGERIWLMNTPCLLSAAFSYFPAA